VAVSIKSSNFVCLNYPQNMNIGGVWVELKGKEKI
jgi:hypothetical protein